VTAEEKDEMARLRAALLKFVDLFEDERVRKLDAFNGAYEDGCKALGRPAKEIG
jgi:hypothetical protein